MNEINILQNLLTIKFVAAQSSSGNRFGFLSLFFCSDIFSNFKKYFFQRRGHIHQCNGTLGEIFIEYSEAINESLNDSGVCWAGGPGRATCDGNIKSLKYFMI